MPATKICCTDSSEIFELCYVWIVIRVYKDDLTSKSSHRGKDEMHHRRVKKLSIHVIWDLRKKSSNRFNLTAKKIFITQLLVEGSLVKQLQTYSSDSEAFIPLVYVVLC